jgi:hypothetical protein
VGSDQQNPKDKTVGSKENTEDRKQNLPAEAASAQAGTASGNTTIPNRITVRDRVGT